MAKKKSASAAPKKKAAVKKTAVKKKAVAPKKAAAAAKKSAAPKKAAAAPKKASPKKKAVGAVKLNPAQTDLLAKVHGAGEAGYPADKNTDLRTLEALRVRKLVKKGSKNKESGHFHYHATASGKKHTGSAPAAPATAPTDGSGAPSTS